MTEENQIVDVPGLFDSRPLGYVQCVTAGNLVFVAGQAGLDERLQIVSPEFAPQARQALVNVRRALEAAGASPADITAITIYLTEIGNLRTFGAIRQEIMGEMQATSTAVEVSALALPGMVVEVTVMAVQSEQEGEVRILMFGFRNGESSVLRTSNGELPPMSGQHRVQAHDRRADLDVGGV
ncbi:MAG: RidA family protein [Thermomicrobiales bacterium]